MRALVPLALLAAAAASSEPVPVYVVRITTERASPSGPVRQVLAAPALPVGSKGLLLAVGFKLDPPRAADREEDRSVRIHAIDPVGREIEARILGGDEALRCTLFRVSEEDFPKPVPLDPPALPVGQKVIVIGRYGERMRYASRRATAEVEAVVTAPRRYYALRGIDAAWRGCIAATPEGEIIGFVDQRPTFTEATGLMVGVGSKTTVIVPLDEYATLARNPPRPSGKEVPAERAWIGVNLAPFDRARELYFGIEEDLRGGLVTGVSPGSPADGAGLKVHDLLQAIGPLEIRYERAEEWDDLLRAVQALPLGEPLPCRILRFAGREGGGFDRERLVLTLVLAERPLGFEEATETRLVDLGLRVKPVTENWRRAASLPAGVSGAVVTGTDSASPAAMAGLRRDDLVLAVDREKVGDVDGLKALVAQARKEGRRKIVLFVRRGTATLFVPIEPGW